MITEEVYSVQYLIGLMHKVLIEESVIISKESI